MKHDYESILLSTKKLDCERILLRRFDQNDAQDIFEFASDEQTLKYIIWEGVKTLDDAKNSLQTFYMINNGVFAIEEKQSGKCIGAIDLRLHPEHEKASFGYMLNRSYWNCGYMSEALGAIIKLAFIELQLNRVESTHYVGNEGSGKVMEKCGMRKEGFAPQEVKIKGIFHDVVHYSVLRCDYDTNAGGM